MTSQIRKYCTIALTVAFFVFQMYLALVKQLTVMLQTPLHMCFALSLVFLYNPIDKGYQKKLKKKAEKNGTAVTDAQLNKFAWARWIDLIFFAAILFVVYYTIMNVDRLRNFDKVTSPVYTIDYVAMVCIIVLLLEAVRRTLGNILFFFIIAFIVYSWTAQYFPRGSVLYTKGKSFAKMLKTFCAGMTLGESGVYGTPLTTSCTSLFYFIVFGAFFSECGGGQLLIDVGLKFSNKSSGGPAKAAVISSGLMGMVSGSAMANVVATGTFTIPMMRKAGYDKEWSAAISAVGSTGGQIMPPIMGSGAFIMAQLIGIAYLSIAKAAIIPAVLYYEGAFIALHYMSKRLGIFGEKLTEKINKFEAIIIFVPLGVFLAFLFMSYTVTKAAFYATLVGVATYAVCAFLQKKDFKLAAKDTGKLCFGVTMEGASSILTMAGLLAGAQISIALISQSGFGVKLSSLIVKIGQGNLFACLLLSMLVCFILGMGMPPTAAYVLAAAVLAPALTTLGMKPLIAHLFVFYFSSIGAITPPVCAAVFLASGIAESNWLKTGGLSVLLAIPAFVVPFTFAYTPALLLDGALLDLLVGTITSFVGVFFIGVSIAGFSSKEMNFLTRALCFAGGMALIIPNYIVSVVGLVVALGGYALSGGFKKNEAKA